MSHDVFICHSAEDKVVADAICSTLETTSIRCWIAPRDVLPGTVWAESIEEAIGDSRIMVLVYSSHSNGSQQVLRELERAVAHGTDILPFRIEDVPASPAVRYYIGSMHWLDALTPPLKEHIDELADKVSALLEHARPAEPVPPGPPRPRRVRLPTFLGIRGVAQPPVRIGPFERGVTVLSVSGLATRAHADGTGWPSERKRRLVG